MPRGIPVTVSPVMLKWALDRSGKAQAVLHRHSYVARWILGTEQPTLTKLRVFANQTNVPFGYLFLPEPPEERLPIPFYRTDPTAPDEPSPDLIETVQILERRQIWLRDYLVSLGQPRLSFVGSVRLGADPRQVAKAIRTSLSLDEQWAAQQPTWEAAFSHLLDKAERAGIIVSSSGIVGQNSHRKLDPGEFRGLVLVDQYAPFLFINAADYKSARMFTFAHELAHLWVGSSAVFDLRGLEPADDVLEKYCNLTAAEFLVPEDEIRRHWEPEGGRPDSFGFLARQFKVSELVVARKALDLELIDRNAFMAFYHEYTKRLTGKADGGGNFYATLTRRLSRRFAISVVQAVREGSILYRDAYRLTGLSGSTFERYAARLGLGEPS